MANTFIFSRRLNTFIFGLIGASGLSMAAVRELPSDSSLTLFELTQNWGLNVTADNSLGVVSYEFRIYGCSRSIYAKSHAECDTEIGVVKGQEADVFFDAIDSVKGSTLLDSGIVRVVAPALIACSDVVGQESIPQCSIESLDSLGAGNF